MRYEAGVVANRDLTSFVEVRKELEQAGANWEDAEVMVDGNLVTAHKPEDLPAFMRAVLRLARKGLVHV
ncbi:MAG: DJ-1/PfpI family protein [Euryarchaeota archaeon]|nr:DJ-1/PfpI family protein [Euryarchaeota archaeon]